MDGFSASISRVNFFIFLGLGIMRVRAGKLMIRNEQAKKDTTGWLYD